MFTRINVLAAILITLFSFDAVACTDTLYRAGKDVSYRVYTAPLPGSVLVYGNSEGARQLAEALAQSGHGVRFVDSKEALTAELSESNYDVIIAPFSDHSTIEDSANATGSNQAVFLPVAKDRDELQIANQSYSKVMVADRHEIKHYLKEIHKVLKRTS